MNHVTHPPAQTAGPSTSTQPNAIPWRSGLLVFWMPLALISLSIWVSHFQPTFAQEASGQKFNGSDEVLEVGKTTPLRQLMFPLLGACCGGLVLLPGRRRRIHSVSLALAATFFFAFRFSSVLWSDAAGTTLRRLLIVGLVLVAAIGIGRHWSTIDLCQAAMILSAIFIVIGILLELRFGTFLRGDEYRFSGTFHPNRMAVCCSILTLSSFAYFRHTLNPWVLGLTFMGLIMTKLTGSRGGQISLLTTMTAMILLTVSWRSRLLAVSLVCVVGSLGLIGIGMVAKQVPALSDLGRMGRTDGDAAAATLTGRIPIWQECVRSVSKRPMLGYGYGAFWTPKRVQQYSYIHDWAFSNAHSIYFETALDIGVAGLALFLSMFSIAGWRAFQLWRSSHDYGAIFILGLFLIAAVHGLVEAVYVSIGIASIFATIAIVVLTLQPLEPRHG